VESTIRYGSDIGRSRASLNSLTITMVPSAYRCRMVVSAKGYGGYLEADHITVEAPGLCQETAEALGIGYAPKGMKGYVAIPIKLGELTGYIGITEAKLPKEFHLSNVVTFPKKTA
jgi:hypothetical protein